MREMKTASIGRDSIRLERKSETNSISGTLAANGDVVDFGSWIVSQGGLSARQKRRGKTVLSGECNLVLNGILSYTEYLTITDTPVAGK